MTKENNLLFVVSAFEIVNNFQKIFEEYIKRWIALWIPGQRFSRSPLVPMDYGKQLFPFVLKSVCKQGRCTSRSTVQKQQDWIFIGCPRMKQVLMNSVDQDIFLNTSSFFRLLFQHAHPLSNNIFACFLIAITPECITPFLPLFMEGRYLFSQEFGKCGGFF